MDRRLAALLVAVLVALAGCNAFFETGEPTVTPGPTATSTVTDDPPGPPPTVATPPESPDTTTPASTPPPSASPPVGLDSLSAIALPPGVSGSRVDVPRLLAAHRERVAAAPHRTRYRVVQDGESDAIVTVVEDATALAIEIDDRDRDGVLQFYVSEDELGTRNTTDGRVLYGHGPLPTREAVASTVRSVRQVPGQRARAARWDAVGVATVNDTDLLVLEPTGLASPAGVDGRDRAVTDVSGQMLVTSAGRITSLRLRFEVTLADGSTTNRGIDYGTSQYETATVDRPAWLSRPPNLVGDAAADGRLLRYDHTAGNALPAGTQINVTRGLVRIGTVTVAERVESGERLYLYGTGEGPERRLHAVVGDRPALPGNATAFSGTVTVEGWVGDAQFQSAVDLASNGSSVT